MSAASGNRPARPWAASGPARDARAAPGTATVCRVGGRRRIVGRLLGGLLVLAMFGVFAVLGVRTAARAADRFGALLAVGITVWVVGQAVINIGAVCGLLPITGIPLPFISFGGTALVTTMFGVGVLANVARRGERAAR